LSTLVAAVVAGDLVDTLSSPGPFTVFAPTNEAFAALPNGTLDSLLQPENKPQLVDILTYHVVGTAAVSSDLVDGQHLITVEGKAVTVHVGDDIKINDAKVVIPDVMASNGVVHVVDAVLTPTETARCDREEALSGQRQIVVPGCEGSGCNANGKDQDCAWCVYDTAMCSQAYGQVCQETALARAAQNVSCKNIVELAEDTAALSTLVAAVVAGDLVDTLSSPGPFTVFAPTNDAFAALPNGTLNSLLRPENKPQLVDILTYHVVGTAAFSSDLVDGQQLATVEGKSLTVHVADDIKINDAKVVIPDVMASNGVVHVVDAVLLPSANNVVV